ncbi:hypothetical protein [Winogradskyella immobilis]|uniref:YD repeat-containing protein n=1 Tax=Winogradskyella immobilis TaxID=2816852 RepID=A0ABS8EJL9_9FLAO|nr:hypothetical protein [Winogradskyella immobilis]MCC1483391.1 hypothetical protein [Winogradskyella immobilis]MCG0015485.1 hypothetical protein [Winogradskyella immobilis]
MLKPSTLFKILFVCILFVTCDDEPLEGEFITNEDVADDDDTDNDDSDDTDNPDEQAFLVSQIVADIQGLQTALIIDYTYDSENRVIREQANNGFFLDYTYENNQLVGTLSGNGVDNTDDIIETYTYDDQGRVATVNINIPDISNNTSNLVYNSDNNVIEVFDAQTNELDSRITLSDGNITRIEEFDGEEIITSETITYDNMNNVHSGANLITTINTIYSENIPSSPFFFGNNNILTQEFTEEGEVVELYSFSYTYNDEGYPISAVEIFEGDTNETVNYTITYTPAN